MVEAGVEYIFANIGSDHPSLVEAIATAREEGRPLPKVITAPHEFVGLSAAHGHAMVSGQAQAVFVHVECGTQNLGGGVHNACKGRAPVLIFAGSSPYTLEGELTGSRNEFIQWTQDTFDQRGIVREYMRYDNEIRTGKNVKQLVHRALQFAHSDPQGPVYLVGAREPMEEATDPVEIDLAHWRPREPQALPSAGVDTVVDALLQARRPLVVTSYLGRKTKAVPELVRLCDRLAIGVVESATWGMNFPADHPMYLGSYRNEPTQNPHLADADVVLVLDSDIPWIPTINRPGPAARLFHIDLDVLKDGTPLHYLPTERAYQADTVTALAQLNARLDELNATSGRGRESWAVYAAAHAALEEALERAEAMPASGPITVAYLMACLRGQLDENAIVLNESITNYDIVHQHLRTARPGSTFTSGAGSLGWNGGAAIGAKLARPDATVVSITGDGCYMFGIPSSVHWMARQYETPFLHIVLNNRGWKAPKMSLLGVHPNGRASRAASIDTTFDPPPDYGGIAVSAGAGFARQVRRPEDLADAVREALRVVREERRCAVLDIWLAHL